jgi:hypothetical protein
MQAASYAGGIRVVADWLRHFSLLEVEKATLSG